MSYINNALRVPTIAVVATLALVAIGLTACGGSSKPTNAAATSGASASTSTTGASPSTSTTGAGPTPGVPRSGPARFSGIRECLKKNGITLPARNATPGGAPTGGGFLGGQLPKGVTRAQFQAAMQKCAPGRFAGGGRPFPRSGAAGPGAAKFKEALSKFAACLRQNGVNVPTPNTSGHGPVFSTKGIQTNSPQFREATKKCRTVLFGAFRARATTHAGSSG